MLPPQRTQPAQDRGHRDHLQGGQGRFRSHGHRRCCRWLRVTVWTGGVGRGATSLRRGGRLQQQMPREANGELLVEVL